MLGLAEQLAQLTSSKFALEKDSLEKQNEMLAKAVAVENKLVVARGDETKRKGLEQKT